MTLLEADINNSSLKIKYLLVSTVYNYAAFSHTVSSTISKLLKHNVYILVLQNESD